MPVGEFRGWRREVDAAAGGFLEVLVGDVQAGGPGRLVENGLQVVLQAFQKGVFDDFFPGRKYQFEVRTLTYVDARLQVQAAQQPEGRQ